MLFAFVATIFLSILNQMEFHLVQNRKEDCHHDHIQFNLEGNENIVFSVYGMEGGSHAFEMLTQFTNLLWVSSHRLCVWCLSNPTNRTDKTVTQQRVRFVSFDTLFDTLLTHYLTHF